MAIFTLLLCCVSFALVRGLSLAEEDNVVHSTIPDEKWGYINVRPHAHMFWWFYGAEGPVEQRNRKPLVIWLQGGPGGSGTGFGNFMEIGPLDVSLKPRESTWLKKANLLFIDNPVGSGYSYVTDDSAYTRNGTEISEDLLTLLKGFFEKLPDLKTMPLYVFSESYGGKMTAAFGVRLYEAIRDGEIECRFDGVALGDSWISPIDSVLSWGPYLYQLNLLDDKDFASVMKIANETAAAYDKGMYALSSMLFDATQNVIDKCTDNVNVYNVLQHNQASPISFWLSAISKKMGHNKSFLRNLAVYHSDPLTQLMNGPMKEKLGIPDSVVWGGQSTMVFEKLTVDFMKPVIAYVSKLLSYNVAVVVYQGQLDMICDTAGAEKWIHRIDWSGLEDFLNAEKIPLYLEGDISKNTAAFKKQWQPLTMYYILKAGHMVPSDAPQMALQMLGDVISQKRKLSH